jgi:transcriptional regulator GlxA family with amidase domain
MAHFLPMRIVLIAFDGAQGLDVFGPAEVFSAAARSPTRARYRVLLASVGGGAVRATSGIALAAVDLRRLRPRRTDTVLVVGGEEAAVRAAVAGRALAAWLASAARTVKRIGSVCSGAFLLAQAGILDGRRAATHWSACDRLAAFRPQAVVDADAIFVRDGKVWTSAGVTTGIDLALAMVEEDYGRALADEVAARLVVYARRPGFQAQFSDVLVAQTAASGALARAIEGLRAHPTPGFDVADLARAAGMSLRTLHRRCAEQLATTPAKLLERLRAEHARLLLTTTALGTKTVAARAGFVSAARMARAFRRTLGVTPREYRLRFGGRDAQNRHNGGYDSGGHTRATDRDRARPPAREKRPRRVTRPRLPETPSAPPPGQRRPRPQAAARGAG